MLYYILFWSLLGFIIHFYIIFWTNLLTGGPAQIVVFAYFRVSQKKNIKRSPNGMKPSGTWFSEQTWSRGLEPYIKKATRRARGRGARPPPSWGPCCSTDVLLPPIYTYVPQTNRSIQEILIPAPQPSVPVRSHLGAFSGVLPEGDPITEGFYINPIALSMKRE